MAKQLSSIAVNALKEALCNVYWYKSELRSFLQHSLSGAAQPLMAQVNWGNYKRQIVSDLVDLLCANQERYLADLTKLCTEVCKMTTFAHLAALDDGARKAERARVAVEALRTMLVPSQEQKREEEEIRRRQKEAAERLQASQAVRAKLDEIRSTFLAATIDTGSPQLRGYKLEKILYDIFELFDLDPKAAFKIAGEQIDGAFSLDGTDYLFEGKWVSDPVGAADIDAFKGKLSRKLDNTLGLFLAINAFSSGAVTLHGQGRSTILLMDGVDLMAVLEGRIDFTSLLVRKRRHAAQTGNVYFRVNEMLGG